MLCVYFFFRLVPKEKDTKKKGTPATSPVLLRHCQAQTGLELASLRQTAPYLRLTVPTLTHLRLCRRAALWRWLCAGGINLYWCGNELYSH